MGIHTTLDNLHVIPGTISWTALREPSDILLHADQVVALARNEVEGFANEASAPLAGCASAGIASGLPPHRGLHKHSTISQQVYKEALMLVFFAVVL